MVVGTDYHHVLATVQASSDFFYQSSQGNPGVGLPQLLVGIFKKG